ncbi:MAG TPA: PIN domain-containing protein [Candidatus Acidoferrum sp.]|nr:PIN domain-containing protein [Candidatus Acidoferrum sp.]
MNVLVDTCVWSLALRRRVEHRNARETAQVEALNAAIESGAVKVLGIVRQELLTGIKTRQQFDNLKGIMDAFPDAEIASEDYIEAAKLGNACYAKGVAPSVVDMLLCAVANRYGWGIFTTDPDFDRYSRIIDLKLHSIEP